MTTVECRLTYRAHLIRSKEKYRTLTKKYTLTKHAFYIISYGEKN